MEFYISELKGQSCLNNREYSTITLDIVLCDSEKTHEYNRDYRNKDYPADIITFAIFADDENSFIFDGEINLGEIVIALDKVINIEVDKEKLVERAVGRRICKACGATYHIQFNPSKEEGVCDICKGELYQRADDNEETVSKRIQVYLDETKPLADYYSKSGIIADIDGQQAIDKVFNDIVSALEGK